MFKDKECRGCKGVEQFCALPSSDCPCLECIVISVCDEHCEKYFNYVNEGLGKIERLTQLIYVCGSSFWIQRAYLVDMESLHKTTIGEDNE